MKPLIFKIFKFSGVTTYFWGFSCFLFGSGKFHLKWRSLWSNAGRFRTFHPHVREMGPTCGKWAPRAGNAPPRAGNAPPRAGNAPPRAGNTPPRAGNAPPRAGNVPPRAGNLPQCPKSTFLTVSAKKTPNQFFFRRIVEILPFCSRKHDVVVTTTILTSFLETNMHICSSNVFG